MTAPPQVPAALCGLYPGAHVIDPDDPDLGKMLVVAQIGESGYSLLNRYNAVYPADVATLSLLLDSPLAMCHAARWLATRLGMDPGVTAPSWERLQCRQHCCDGATGEMVDCTRPVWSIMGADDVYVIFADCPDPEEWDGDDVRHVPGISALTDPAEALAAACVAVGGAP